jgi:hypothetical protein
VTLDEVRERHEPTVTVPPVAGDQSVRLDRRDGDAQGQGGAGPHGAGVRDDLDLPRLVAETGQDDVVENVALE